MNVSRSTQTALASYGVQAAIIMGAVSMSINAIRGSRGFNHPSRLRPAGLVRIRHERQPESLTVHGYIHAASRASGKPLWRQSYDSPQWTSVPVLASSG